MAYGLLLSHINPQGQQAKGFSLKIKRRSRPAVERVKQAAENDLGQSEDQTPDRQKSNT